MVYMNGRTNTNKIACLFNERNHQGTMDPIKSETLENVRSGTKWLRDETSSVLSCYYLLLESSKVLAFLPCPFYVVRCHFYTPLLTRSIGCLKYV